MCSQKVCSPLTSTWRSQLTAMTRLGRHKKHSSSQESFGLALILKKEGEDRNIFLNGKRTKAREKTNSRTECCRELILEAILVNTQFGSPTMRREYNNDRPQKGVRGNNHSEDRGTAYNTPKLIVINETESQHI